MKHKFLISLILGTALIISGCGEQGPTSPELSQSEDAAILAKHGKRKDKKRKITEVSSLSTVCNVIPGEQIIADNILIIRGQKNFLLIESNDKRMNGKQEAILNIVVNLTTGSTAIWGTVSIEPEKVGGTWEGFFAVHGVGAFLAGNAVLHGTRGLDGQVMILEIHEVPAEDKPPCEIALPGEPKTQTSASGFIFKFKR